MERYILNQEQVLGIVKSAGRATTTSGMFWNELDAKKIVRAQGYAEVVIEETRARILGVPGQQDIFLYPARARDWMLEHDVRENSE